MRRALRNGDHDERDIVASVSIKSRPEERACCEFRMYRKGAGDFRFGNDAGQSVAAQ